MRYIMSGTKMQMKDGTEKAMTNTAMMAMKEPGDSQRVMQVGEAIVAEAYRIDGVDYELYRAKNPNDKRGVVRVANPETGEAITLKVYPDFSQAHGELGKAIAILGYKS
jgi:hypothetical protein